MLLTALFLVSMSGAANLHGAQPNPDHLRLEGALGAPSPWSLDLSLRSETFGFDGAARARAQSLAQSASQPTTPPAGAAPAQTTGGGSAQTPPTGQACPAAGESCEIDCETCRESDTAARYLYRRRAAVLRTHRAFAIAAWGSLVATEVFGTIMAFSRDTWFGDGACNGSAFADRHTFVCGSTIRNIHSVLAFTTVGLYTTAGILAVSAPDPDRASVGNDRPARRLRLHKILAWVHAGGMILMPFLGIMSANPQIVGIDPATDTQGALDFQRGMRTIHEIVGFTTLSALTFAGVLELL